MHSIKLIPITVCLKYQLSLITQFDMKLIVYKQLIAELHFLPHQCFDKLFNIKWIKWVLIIEQTLAKNSKTTKEHSKNLYFVSNRLFLKCFVNSDTHCFVLFIIQPHFFSIWQVQSFRLNSNIICTIAFFFCWHSPPYLFIFICTRPEIEF